jgi:hypothetical protein
MLGVRRPLLQNQVRQQGAVEGLNPTLREALFVDQQTIGRG